LLSVYPLVAHAIPHGGCEERGHDVRMDETTARPIVPREPEKVTAMSRKSVIQLVPAPAGRGDASDLRYRLLMAALGSGEEANPLLSGPDIPADLYDAGATAKADTVPESAPIHPNQDVPAPEPRPVDGSGVAGPESHAPALSLVRPQAPPLLRNTGSETPVPAGATPLQRLPKPR
jgi:hypothetical protein